MKYIIYALFILIFSACATNEINKDDNEVRIASYYYESLIEDIREDRLDKADNNFSLLESYHPESPLIKEATILMFFAHAIRHDITADYYINRYTKKYGDKKNITYVNYLKLISNYSAVNHSTKHQKFLIDSIEDINNYIAKYTESNYMYFAKHLLLVFKLAEAELNKSAIYIYGLQDKDDAAKIYKEKNDKMDLKDIAYLPSNIPWWIKILNW